MKLAVGYAEEVSRAVEALRSEPVAADARLVRATQMRVRFHASRLRESREQRYVAGLDGVPGRGTFRNLYRSVGCGERLPGWANGQGVSTLAWQARLHVLFFVAPALVVVGLLLLARGTHLASDHRNAAPAIGTKNEEVENFMQLGNETPTGLSSEIKIVPAWAWVLAGVAFLAAQWFFNIEIARHSDPPPEWARPLLGLVAGIGAACYLLFVGYANRDSKRRGMSPTLWTIVAALIPNALGIILFISSCGNHAPVTAARSADARFRMGLISVPAAALS